MDLKEKLKFYESSLKPAKEEVAHKPDIRTWVDGQEMENEYGHYFLVSRSVILEYQHGDQNLIPPLFSDAVFSIVGKDEILESFDPMKALYLDTETTGLAGGTGTVPFMIGIGFFNGSGFTVEQYFMRDYSEENAMLHAFLKKSQDYDALVTYNGKCYDVNLITSRLIMNRIKNSIQDLPHLDLLFTARRLYKRRLGDCSLGNIENHILGFSRQNDVPGFLIPGIYFHFLRTGQGERLAAVFDHNHWDILSLAALTFHMGQVFSDPDSHLENELDWFSLAKACESVNQVEYAVKGYEKALQSSDQTFIDEVRGHLAILHKRLFEWEKAVQYWELMTKQGHFYLSPYEELAKYYEHQDRDYEKAIIWVMKALERLEMQMELHPELDFENEKYDLIYRLDRLKRKLQ